MADESIAKLMRMGFKFDLILNALEAANNDEQLAISFLTAQTTSSNRNYKKNVKQKAKKKQKEVISWEVGRQRIYEQGIKPFFNRIECVFSDKIFAFDKHSLTSTAQNQFVLCYDCIFDLCIQRAPHNYTKQCYNLHIDSLREYFNDTIKLQLISLQNRNIIGIDKDIKYFIDFIQIYKKCKIVMDGLNRFFLYLNRFHVPNSKGVMTLEGHSLLAFYKDIFHIHSKYLIRALFKCINRCRQHKLSLIANPNANLYQFYDSDYYKIKKLIKICVNIIFSLDNGLNSDELKTKTLLIKNCKQQILREKDELFVKGFLREMSENMAEFNSIVPLEINTMIISYYGQAEVKSIYDEYFWSIFQLESTEYYNKKCVEIYNCCHNLSQYICFTQKCIKYETDQLNQCTNNQIIWNDKNAQFIHSMCHKFYDEELHNKYLLNLCQINNEFISLTEIKKHFVDIYKSLHLLNTNIITSSLVYQKTPLHKTYTLKPSVSKALTELFNKYSNKNNFMFAEHLQTFLFSLPSVSKLESNNVQDIMQKYKLQNKKVQDIMHKYGTAGGNDNDIYSLSKREFLSFYKTECVLRQKVVWNDLTACGYDLRQTKKSKMFRIVMENARNDICLLFNRYVQIGKGNKLNKDIYKKYKLIYDSFDIYQLFMKYNDNCCFGVVDNKYLDRKYRKMINKTFLDLFIELIGKEYEYINILLNKFINFIIKNAYCIDNIDAFIDYVGFIHNELLMYAHPKFTNNEFENKYLYFFKTRIKSKRYLSLNRQRKLIYFERKMIDKLNNLHVKQVVESVITSHLMI